MLKLKSMNGLLVEATDGTAGRVHEILFNSLTLNAEYIVVNIDTVLNKNLVLIKPGNVAATDLKNKKLYLNITSDEVKNSNKITSIFDEYEPVDKYAWPYYWLGTGGGFPGITPSSAFPLQPINISVKAKQKLSSSRDIAGFKLKTSDGHKFRVRNMLLDENSLNIKSIAITPTYTITALSAVIISVNSILGFNISYGVLNLENTLAEIKNSNGLTSKDNYGYAFNFRSIL